MALPPMEWIERVIRIDSITHHSNEDIVRFLVPLLEETGGLRIEEQLVVENGERFRNLIAFNDSPDSEDLLVLQHPSGYRFRRKHHRLDQDQGQPLPGDTSS